METLKENNLRRLKDKVLSFLYKLNIFQFDIRGSDQFWSNDIARFHIAVDKFGKNPGTNNKAINLLSRINVKQICQDCEFDINKLINYIGPESRIYPMSVFKVSTLGFPSQIGQETDSIFDFSKILSSNFIMGMILANQIDPKKIFPTLKGNFAAILKSLGFGSKQENQETINKSKFEHYLNRSLEDLFREIQRNTNKMFKVSPNATIEWLYSVKSPRYFRGGSFTRANIISDLHLLGILCYITSDQNPRLKFLYLDDLVENGIEDVEVAKKVYMWLLRTAFYYYIWKPWKKMQEATKYPVKYHSILAIKRNLNDETIFLGNNANPISISFTQKYFSIITGYAKNLSLDIANRKLSYIPTSINFSIGLEEANYTVFDYLWESYTRLEQSIEEELNKELENVHLVVMSDSSPSSSVKSGGISI